MMKSSIFLCRVFRMKILTGKVVLGITEDEVALGSHLIHFWQNKEEFERGVRFLELGIENESQYCVLFVHDEAKPFLKQLWRDNIRVVGFVRDPENYLDQGTVHVFPSQWEGSAKVTYEAAACGLPQITTREAGDVVRHGIEGIIVKPADVNAIATALEHLYRHPELVQEMGTAARRRVVENFTWDHFRTRLLNGYETAMRMAR